MRCRGGAVGGVPRCLSVGQRTLSSFAGTVAAPATLTDAKLTALDTEAYDPVTLTVESVDVTAGDVLLGGGARDTFVYNLGDGVDVIGDYTRGETIKLVGIDKADVTSIVHDGNITLLFDDGAGGFVPDAAIEVIGVTNFASLHLNYTTVARADSGARKPGRPPRGAAPRLFDGSRVLT